MEVIIDGIVYVPKENKSKLEMLEEKYKSGNYICIGSRVGSNDKIRELDWPKWLVDWKYKLIHKKHRNILDAWLNDNNVEIEYHIERDLWAIDKNFIDKYEEDCEYRLKQQYPIFKRNKDGEVFRFDNIYGFSTVLAEDFEATHLGQGETIPYDKERGLYHLQPVFYKPNDIDCCIDFYDAKYCQLVRRGAILKYYNIEPITPEQLKTMPFVWEMYKKYKG